VARNLDLHFILATQRLQDLNTKIRGRTRLLVGNVSLDDYELKIRRILRHSKYKKDVLSFKVGEFLYAPLDLKVKLKKFSQQGKPKEIKVKVEMKPKTKRTSKIATKIKSFLSNIKMLIAPSIWLSEHAKKQKGKEVKKQVEVEEIPEEPSVYDEEEEFDSELEEDLATLGEPDEEW